MSREPDQGEGPRQLRHHLRKFQRPGKSIVHDVPAESVIDYCFSGRQAPTSADGQVGEWIVQDSCTNSCESIVTYAPVDAAVLQPVISGHDSSGVALLPCGFAVVPDGLEARPAVITSRKEDGAAAGSLVTVAFQVLASSTPAVALSPEYTN